MNISRSDILRLLSHAFIPGKLNTLAIATLLSPPLLAEYYFDPALLQGSRYGAGLDLARFSEAGNGLSGGEYVLDIYLNGQLIRAKQPLTVGTAPESARLEPCLSQDIIAISAIRLNPQTRASEAQCLFLSELGPTVNWEVSLPKLRLDLVVPQAGLYHTPRGYIPVSEWDAGATALYLRHNTNFSHTENTQAHFRYNYLWSNINSGLNLGLWQLRHQGNLRYVDNSLSGSQYKYNPVKTWVQRPLPQLNSLISIGDNYTSSSMFGSLSFNGIKLGTDQRMWPQGKRGYAPEVRGVAATSARVVVRQQGRVIYETTVSPGAFVINDLFSTRGQGDLNVDVVEANGQISTFTVPYSAVPDSVRPGNWSYELSTGYVRHYYNVENTFFEGVLQHGINNYLTGNIGGRIADKYAAGLFGGVVATSMGAFGLNAVYSNARVEQDDRQQGWRAEASYSKTFTTGTNLSLAAYRYSTRGYRDLQDVLGVRKQNKGHDIYTSDTLNQRSNFSATISQQMGEWGMLNLSGSTADYYHDTSRLTQLQLGYSKSWRGVSFNFNASRQRSTHSNRYNTSVNDADYDASTQRKYTENVFSLGISIPLDFGSSRSQLNFDMNRSRDTRSAMVGVSGTAGEKSTFSYSTYAGIDSHDNDGGSTTFGGNVERRTSFGALRASASKGNWYRQYGIGTSGTVVLHSGGVTAGPYTSETFALVEASGARGAVVRNGQGATVDRFGYALLPSVTPYRYNSVSLESQEMNADAELQGGSQRVAPYAGAIAHVKFDTISGKPALINTSLKNGELPPMGADVMNSDGDVIGMVGQGGQIYARLAPLSGTLVVKWGENKGQQCRVRYQLPGQADTLLYQLTLPCHQE